MRAARTPEPDVLHPENPYDTRRTAALAAAGGAGTVCSGIFLLFLKKAKKQSAAVRRVS